jgi:hypothetical protein
VLVGEPSLQSSLWLFAAFLAGILWDATFLVIFFAGSLFAAFFVTAFFAAFFGDAFLLPSLSGFSSLPSWQAPSSGAAVTVVTAAPIALLMAPATSDGARAYAFSDPSDETEPACQYW